jgi:uncharacterized protein (TIGR00255 family)
MTGYGYAEQQDDRYSVAVEVKSYNNRYLDINLSMPGAQSSLEASVREKIGAACRRGRVEVYIRFRDGQEDVAVNLDADVATAYLCAIREVKELAGIEEPVQLSHLLPREGLLRSERSLDPDSAWSHIEPLLDQALETFKASRTTEGLTLAADIASHLEQIELFVDNVEQHAEQIEKTIYANLRQRFDEVLGNAVDENRVLSEVAVQLTRFSINEEIVRLRTHIAGFREICAQEGPVGKKLDFLCQELNREINTTGSKSILVEVNQKVVEAKDALENIREQLRNVE